jgi:hypothetical protein
MLRTIVNQYNPRTLLAHNNIVKGAVYRHYKGNLYKVLNIGSHSEPVEIMVIYNPLDISKVTFRYDQHLCEINRLIVMESLFNDLLE